MPIEKRPCQDYLPIELVESGDKVAIMQKIAGQFGIRVLIKARPGEEYEVRYSGHRGVLAEGRFQVEVHQDEPEKDLSDFYRTVDQLAAERKKQPKI